MVAVACPQYLYMLQDLRYVRVSFMHHTVTCQGRKMLKFSIYKKSILFNFQLTADLTLRRAFAATRFDGHVQEYRHILAGTCRVT